MTLSISAYYRLAGETPVDIPLESDLAGVEAARHDFYGSPWAVNLGLVLLPQLKHTAVVEVCGTALSDLIEEVEILKSHLPVTALEQDYWNFRLDNIIKAANLASKYGNSGCICIS